MALLSIEQVRKDFGSVQAVKGLSLAVDKGQIFGLLGPNGAGKTTTIRMIMGIILPDDGTISCFGTPDRKLWEGKVAYLPEERGLYRKMTVESCIQFFGQLHGMKPSDAAEKTEYWLKRLGLDDWKDKQVQELSRGMQQKVQFICTILADPQLIILDEPFTGLDPVNTQMIKDVILELKEKGSTIIFSTHLMDQVEKLCEGICLINKGQAVLQGKLADIKQKHGQNRVRLMYEGNATFLKDSTLVQHADDYGNYVEIIPAENIAPQQILKKAMEDVVIKKFEMTEPSLHEIFIQTVQGKGGRS